MKRILYSILSIVFCIKSSAQLTISNTGFFIEGGTTVTVLGDVTSNADITGTGWLLLKGSTLQNVNMGGFTIPNLELDNTADATLLSTNTRIGTNFLFTNGKIQAGNLSLILGPSASITGATASRFVQLNGTGQLVKELTGDIAGFELPVGENANYRPAYLTSSGSTYDAGASFGIRVLGTADPNIPPMIGSYLKTNWPVTKTGITGGSVSLSGQYIDPTDVTGTKANLFGYYFNGTDWSSAGETHNASANQVGAPVTTASGVVSGLNKFLAVGTKVFLQGAYDPATGLMTDNLRTLPFGTSASTANFPSSDPYRVAPYNVSFTHTANSEVEMIANSGVIGAQIIPGNNIVDWVFLELRNLNASPGNVILQTRSALLQRDGDITDIDGISPVTFNNLPDGNYILAVRHRNHLGLSFDQSSPKNFSETKSTAFTTNAADLRTATEAQLFGTAAAFTTASHPVLGTVNLLWAGNASGNTIVRFTGSNGPGNGVNDRVALLQAIGNNESNILIGYFGGDLNLSRIMRYLGSNGPASPNDRIALLQFIGNNENVIQIQSIPN